MIFDTTLSQRAAGNKGFCASWEDGKTMSIL